MGDNQKLIDEIKRKIIDEYNKDILTKQEEPNCFISNKIARKFL